jgi:hypothetical protein
LRLSCPLDGWRQLNRWIKKPNKYNGLERALTIKK